MRTFSVLLLAIVLLFGCGRPAKPYCPPFQVCGQYRSRQAVYLYLKFRRLLDHGIPLADYCRLRPASPRCKHGDEPTSTGTPER
jgi:hypothetical protein